MDCAAVKRRGKQTTFALEPSRLCWTLRTGVSGHIHARYFGESEIGSASQTGRFLRAQQLYLAEIVDRFLQRFAKPVAITDVRYSVADPPILGSRTFMSSWHTILSLSRRRSRRA